MSARHKAREMALQILFQWDIHGSDGPWLEDFWAQREATQATREFAEGIVEGVIAHRQEIDGMLNTQSTNWSITRMPIVDRNILRQGLYELLYLPEVPAKVTMNEAIELAKSFADDETKRFVNGILDNILKGDPRLEAKRLEMAAEASG